MVRRKQTSSPKVWEHQQHHDAKRSNTLHKPNRPRFNRRRGLRSNRPCGKQEGAPQRDLSRKYIITLEPEAQSELSAYDGVAAMVAEYASGLVRDADLAPGLIDLFATEDERQTYRDALSRAEDAHSLVVAWNGDVPLLCPRAATGLARFRLALESLGYDDVGFAATMHDNLGNPSLHGAAWAMVLRGPSVTVVKELMRQAWHEATVAVRPHKCGWCSEPAGGTGTVVI